MKIKITEKQLSLIKENESKDLAIIDKLYSKYEGKVISWRDFSNIGRQLYNMGIIELTPEHPDPESPMGNQLLHNQARELRLDYVKRSGKQLYQVTLSERVYASADVTYIVDSNDPDTVQEILDGGYHLEESMEKDENGKVKCNFDDWQEDSLQDALEYHDLKELIIPYKGDTKDFGNITGAPL
jgi:hypothetical protein